MFYMNIFLKKSKIKITLLNKINMKNSDCKLFSTNVD